MAEREVAACTAEVEEMEKRNETLRQKKEGLGRSTTTIEQTMIEQMDNWTLMFGKHQGATFKEMCNCACHLAGYEPLYPDEMGGAEEVQVPGEQPPLRQVLQAEK